MSFLGFPTTIPSIGDLAGSIGGIVDSVIGDFLDTITGDTKFKRLYEQPESDFKQYSETQADRRKWHTVPRDRSTKSYFFLLKYKGKVVQVPFNINPQRETITEPHGETVEYTQGGGKILHSEGAITKDITIQGTCGLYPGERRKRLPDSGIGSGFESFEFLKNVFRKYCFLRRYGDLANGLQLIYVNARRQEAWVVTPKTFTSEDATEHNFHFSYTIVLETLYPYDGAETKSLIERLFDSIPGWRQIDAVVQRVVEATDVVYAAAGQISAIVDGFGSTVMSRVLALSAAYAQVTSGNLKLQLAFFKRESVKETLALLRQAHAQLEAAGASDLANKLAKLERAITASLLLDSVFDNSNQNQARSVTNSQRAQIANFTSPTGVAVSPDDALAAGAVAFRPGSAQIFDNGDAPTPRPLPGTATGQFQSSQQNPALNTSTVSTVGGSALDTTGKLQVSRFTSTDEDADALAPTTLQIESQLNWDQGRETYLANIDPENADYLTSRVKDGDSIRTVAFRLLGDFSRWPELVLLNNLQYPYVASQAYITANGLTNCIPWGGIVKYPVPKRVTVPRRRVWRNETFQSLALDPFQRSLGNDILINEKTGDVQWDANDLALVYGVNNLAQFMRKRVVTRKNTLRRSIRLGFSQYVGLSAGSLDSLIAAEARTLFFDDERISTSEAVTVQQNAQVLTVGIVAQVRDYQDPIVLTTDIGAM